MSQHWEGKVIVITGASSGIGRALALALASDAAKLVLVARDRERLQSVADRCQALGVETLAVAIDVTDSEACRVMVQQVVERFSRIDALINNAVISMWGAFDYIGDPQHF